MTFDKTKIRYAVLFVVLVAAAAYRLHDQFIPFHTRLVSDKDDLRTLALNDLSAMDATRKSKLIEPLIQDLQNPNARVRRLALYSLRKINPVDDRAMGAFVSMLDDKEEAVRKEAAVSLMEAGKPALPWVAPVFKSDNEPARNAAVEIFKTAGVDGLPLLIKLLEDPLPVVRANAASVVGSFGPAAKEAGPVLLKGLSTKDPEPRLQMALALAAIDPTLTVETSVLTDALAPLNWGPVMYEAVKALEKMGPAAKSGIPALKKYLLLQRDSFSKSPYPRPAIAHALTKIDPRREALIDLGWDLKQKDPVLHYRAALMIDELNPPNPGAVEILVGALGDKDVATAARAMHALIKIGLDNTERLQKTAYPAMIALMARAGDEKAVEDFNAAMVPAIVTAVEKNQIPPGLGMELLAASPSPLAHEAIHQMKS